MKIHALPSFPLFLTITCFISTQLPLCLCSDDLSYTNCSQPVACGGNITITYPFWGANRARYCGQPGFELACQNNVPVIPKTPTSFRILDINYEARVLNVAQDDYWNSTCPTYLRNATFFNLTAFSPAPLLSNLTLYYGCTFSNASPSGLLPLSDCTVNSTVVNLYYATATIPVDPLVWSCNSSVVVQVNETAVQAVEQNTTTVTDALMEGVSLQWSLENAQCNACVNSGGACGYDSTESQFTCFCRDQPYGSVCPSTPGSSSKSNGIVLAITLPVVGIVAAILLLMFALRRNLLQHMLMLLGNDTMDDQIETFIQKNRSLTPKRYSYSDVKKMTNSFKDKLGEGGYGTVYKGKLSDERLVAVKVLFGSKGNGEEFMNEVASISATSHVNVVTLVGFCYERTKRALVYEFMPNGSLEKFICPRGSSSQEHRLDWKTLYQIAVGIARGLDYLHRGCNTRIVHLDIKPQNILLDERFRPKISDFGLAKLCKMEESIVSMLAARGTAGYIAPEVFCRNFGGVSHKSDVYSYRMMVIDMVGERTNNDVRVSHTSEMYFPKWIYKHLEVEENFHMLHEIKNEEEEEIARKMITVSLWCIQTNPSDRPSMTKVLEMLEGSLQSLEIPPIPFFSSPQKPMRDTTSTISSTF